MTQARAILTASTALAVLATGAPLAADEKPESTYVTALRDCQGKTDPAERLACYDTAVAAMVAASTEGEVRVVDRAEVRETRRKLFGFALPDLGIFGGRGDKDGAEEEAEEFTTLNTTIAGVRTSSGSYVLVTAEGAQWKLDEVPARLMKPKVGQSLEIKKGALSSYFLRINGQNGVKGRRVQ